MPYISPMYIAATRLTHVPYSRERGVRMNDAFARMARVEWKEERTHSTKERERIARGANKRHSASAYNERKKRDSLMRICWLLSMYASLTLRTFALPYGRHRLPLTVSQRSLCNILSSLNGARYAVQSPRKDSYVFHQVRSTSCAWRRERP